MYQDPSTGKPVRAKPENCDPVIYIDRSITKEIRGQMQTLHFVMARCGTKATCEEEIATKPPTAASSSGDDEKPKPVCTDPEEGKLVMYADPSTGKPTKTKPESCEKAVYIEKSITKVIHGQTRTLDFVMAMCGTQATCETEIDPDMDVGGIPCIGDTDVTIKMDGVTITTAKGEDQCVPCTEKEPDSDPNNKAALVACGLFGKTVGYVIDKIGEGAEIVADFFAGDFADFWKDDFADFFADDVGGWLEGAGEDTADWFSGAGEDFADWFSGAGEDVGDWFEGAGEDTADWFEGAGEDTADWFEGAGEDTADWFEGAIDDTGDWFKGAGNSVGDFFGDLF